VHLLSYVVKCTVTDSPFNTQADCSKCPPSASMHFLTRVTRELVTLRSTAVLLMLLAALRIRWSSSSVVFTLCAYTIVFMYPTLGNLMGSALVTVVANSVHRHDQSIDLGIYDSGTALLKSAGSSSYKTLA